MSAEILAATIMGGGLITAAGRATLLWREMADGTGPMAPSRLEEQINNLQTTIDQATTTFDGIISDARARARNSLKVVRADFAAVTEQDPVRKRNLMIKRALLRGAYEGFIAGSITFGSLGSLVVVAQTLMQR